MLKKILYLVIIISVSLYIFNFFVSRNEFVSGNFNISSSDLTDNSSTSPKRLFLNSWRLIKLKYYDSTLNRQDWYRWRSHYVDEIKTKEDAYVAINSMLASLNDPYSRFLNEKEYQEQNESIDAKITGIGVNITTNSGKIVVVNVVEDTPAEKGGIKSGDVFLKVNGKNVQGLDLSDVAKLIRGEIGTSVTIELIRGKNKLEKTITRDEVKIKNVVSKILDKDIGYIQIISFIGTDVADEFVEALEKTSEAKSLIIDLRGNTGGLMPNAVLIANLFISDGKIVSVVDRNGLVSSINAEDTGFQVTKPTVLLIDEMTASASEILSGALKDSGKAVLVGQKTFGKGMIQKIYPMPERTGINLTIAKYLTPKGTDINKIGIQPDYKIKYEQKKFNDEIVDTQLEKAKSVLKNELAQKQKTAALVR